MLFLTSVLDPWGTWSTDVHFRGQVLSVFVFLQDKHRSERIYWLQESNWDLAAVLKVRSITKSKSRSMSRELNRRQQSEGFRVVKPKIWCKEQSKAKSYFWGLDICGCEEANKRCCRFTFGHLRTVITWRGKKCSSALFNGINGMDVPFSREAEIWHFLGGKKWCWGSYLSSLKHLRNWKPFNTYLDSFTGMRQQKTSTNGLLFNKCQETFSSPGC